MQIKIFHIFAYNTDTIRIKKYIIKKGFILTVGGSRNLHKHLKGNLAIAIKILHIYIILPN